MFLHHTKLALLERSINIMETWTVNIYGQQRAPTCYDPTFIDFKVNQYPCVDGTMHKFLLEPIIFITQLIYTDRNTRTSSFTIFVSMCENRRQICGTASM